MKDAVNLKIILHFSILIGRCKMKRPLEYSSGARAKCPHCHVVVQFTDAYREMHIGRSVYQGNTELMTSGGDYAGVHIYSSRCPHCNNPVVYAKLYFKNGKQDGYLVVPRNIVRIVPPEVPAHIREDFLEAAAVLPFSEKASAALARRCLESLLDEQEYKGKNLNEKIEAALKDLPSRLAENLDAVRQVGNFAAHPIKYEKSNTIVDVEPEEANWTLEVLEDLFDYFYVQPKRAEERRKRLEEKLKKAGKPPLKRPSKN